MSTFKSIEEAREHYKDDKFATGAGVYIEELSDGYCKCSMRLDERHRNAIGGIMGGAIFTVADLAFSAASNNIHQPTVAQQVSMNFMSTVKGDTLIAEAKCKKDGGSSCVYNVDVTDNTGRGIAQFVATGFKL